MKPAFQCPASMRPHVERVLRGEYDVPGIDAPKVVLDIGANVGAFSVWALRKWPEAEVFAFEPETNNFALLRKNTQGMHVSAIREAVYVEGQLRMWGGRNNCGEASLFLGHEQDPDDDFKVEARGPHELVACDFMKLDVEGAELVILLGYPHLAVCKAIALEWHSEDLRMLIRHYLTSNGFACVEDKPWRPDRGIMKWRKQ